MWTKIPIYLLTLADSLRYGAILVVYEQFSEEVFSSGALLVWAFPTMRRFETSRDTEDYIIVGQP